MGQARRPGIAHRGRSPWRAPQEGHPCRSVQSMGHGAHLPAAGLKSGQENSSASFKALPNVSTPF